ncbi:MAG: 1,4-dihydroxy-6-naphthoate synthase [Desulfobulbaceae bacterium]|nr:1,4-dihydroxy-6-naphthoate synthase [Desulfobulbaceae bacterium]
MSIGYSPCPNDTYIFNALVNGRVELAGARLAPPVLEDVETLNEWALKGKLDITKVSFHAYGHLRQQYQLLSSGAALGRNCGPLFITGPYAKPADPAQWRIAIPGRYTTAALLLQLFRPGSTVMVMRFDRIMDALSAGEVDAGVIIHESRFTYQERGLVCIQDLGEWWEQETSLPIPLGCIIMRKNLDDHLHRAVEMAIRKSIEWADAHPQEGLSYIRSYAQEIEPEVMLSHINLYVNDFSKDIGADGAEAIKELLRRGEAAGLFAA